METLLIPAARSGVPPLCSSSLGSVSAVTRTLLSSVTLPQLYRRLPIPANVHSHFFSPPDSFCSSSSSLSSLYLLNTKGMMLTLPSIASSASVDFNSSASESDQAELAQVAKRLEKTSRYFKRLGSIGFWGQLIFTVAAAVILSFSIVVTGKITSPFTFYATTAGIAAAFVSVFWAFGYLRLAERLRKTAIQPSKSLKNGMVVNLVGIGAAILGMQATVGLLVGKALTSSANPFYQGISPGYSPVLALDVFLVQASANTILSHFLGLASSLELLRSVTLQPTQAVPVPKGCKLHVNYRKEGDDIEKELFAVSIDKEENL